MSWDPRDAIMTKRDGGRVPSDTLERLVHGFAGGEIGDGPMAAFLMACVIQGMDASETAAMTRAFVASGRTVPLGDVGRPVVDKHSTGGVGDAVSLVFAPLAATLGLACVKVSGRGLGHTGGTIDKLEAIPGFRAALEIDEIRRQAAEVGCVIASQSRELVPADGAVYALRDATAAVRSIPLIAASVMAKKLAIGSDLILLDVKVGSGAFMRDEAEASALVEACLAIAREAHRPTTAAITDMSQPLGTAIGNALEIVEAIEVLRGERTGRLRDLSVWLAARALSRTTGLGFDEASRRAETGLRDGSAIEVFAAMIRAQGGDPEVIEHPAEVLPVAPVRVPVDADRDGFLTGVDAAAIGRAASTLGAGRGMSHGPIDPAVGIVLPTKVGDRVQRGSPIGVVNARDEAGARAAVAAVWAACTIGADPAQPPPLVHGWSQEVD
ncbi:MAG: thymidine phosphorylase [Actinomycetota bacterium]